MKDDVTRQRWAYFFPSQRAFLYGPSLLPNSNQVIFFHSYFF
ncbi:unnamed protein product, partial [Arabidopsis halleri]